MQDAFERLGSPTIPKHRTIVNCAKRRKTHRAYNPFNFAPLWILFAGFVESNSTFSFVELLYKNTSIIATHNFKQEQKKCSSGRMS